MSDKTPLVLLPGLLCDARLWAPQVAALADIAASHVADLTWDDDIGDMAERLLEEAPERFALAGLSMGGYVAFEIMRRAPERVMRLALFDTSARPDTEDQTTRRRGLIDLAEKGKFKGVTPRLLPLLVHEDRLEDRELTDLVMAMAEFVGQSAFIRQQRAIMGRVDSRPDLAQIDCPTTVVCGRQDALTPPEMAEEMAQGIPDARLEIIEDCGHLSTLERPETVNRIMRGWLG